MSGIKLKTLAEVIALKEQKVAEASWGDARLASTDANTDKVSAGMYRRNEYTSKSSNNSVKSQIFKTIKTNIEKLDDNISVEPDGDTLTNSSASIYILIGGYDNKYKNDIIKILRMSNSWSKSGYIDNTDF